MKVIVSLSSSGHTTCHASAAFKVSKINPMQNNFFLSTGTGLKIPPAAQQALQMTGSIPFGGIGAPAGEPR